jgi:hypothetical protein
VQVQVADVRADVAGAAQPTWAFMLAPSIYTCPPLSWMMRQMSHDGLFKHAVGGGIGDHERGQPVLVLLGFGAQIGHVDVAVSSQATTTTSMPAMTALAGLVPWAEAGDEADGALPFAAAEGGTRG